MAESVPSVDSPTASVRFDAKAPSTPPPRAVWKLVLPVAILVTVGVVVLLLVGSR
jgi:hypothetical protein